MYYKYHKVNFKRGDSKINSWDWIKKKKVTINQKNTDDKCFQYAVNVALNYEEIKWNPVRVSNIKPFINKYHRKGTNYPSKIDNWKTFEKNNPTIALNILYIKEKGTSSALSYNISLSYKISQILIRIKKKNFSNDSKWRKRKMALSCSKKIICNITWTNFISGFYCLNSLDSFRTENKFKSHEKVSKNTDFCGIAVPSEKGKILEFNQYMKLDKMPYII